MLQGHCHPKILQALSEQAERLTLSSRAFYNDKFPIFAELLTSMFGYEMMLPMNTGAEGVETALKLARKWGYLKKKIPKDEVNRQPKLFKLEITFYNFAKGVGRMHVLQSMERSNNNHILKAVKSDFHRCMVMQFIYDACRAFFLTA